MSVEEIKRDALRLNPEARANLACELLASLDTMSDAEIEKLWVNEAVRRNEELDRGIARAYPVKDVLARARARRK